MQLLLFGLFGTIWERCHRVFRVFSNLNLKFVCSGMNQFFFLLNLLRLPPCLVSFHTESMTMLIRCVWSRSKNIQEGLLKYQEGNIASIGWTLIHSPASCKQLWIFLISIPACKATPGYGSHLGQTCRVCHIVSWVRSRLEHVPLTTSFKGS